MVDGNKPKQQRAKPVDKQSNLNLTEAPSAPTPLPLQPQDFTPDFRSQSFFTRKQISDADRRKKWKVQRKSRQINRLVAKGKR